MMLCLKNESNSGWIGVAKQHLIEVIIDHAHCEKKAAHTGMVMLSKYPEKTELCFAMADLVEEEIGHFRSVMQILERRNEKLTPDKGDEYARSLFTQLRKDEKHKLLDHLLIAGIIEARSCERLQILAKHIEDEELRKFYKNLADSEAGHYTTFVKLAKIYYDENEVKQRLDELTNYEADIVKRLKNEPTMHG
jgi:tRNA-(ms[2]io[6]A)-hydroxylase